MQKLVHGLGMCFSVNLPVRCSQRVSINEQQISLRHIGVLIVGYAVIYLYYSYALNTVRMMRRRARPTVVYAELR